MTRVRVHNFTISLDGYGAGARQSRENPVVPGPMMPGAAGGGRTRHTTAQCSC